MQTVKHAGTYWRQLDNGTIERWDGDADTWVPWTPAIGDPPQEFLASAGDQGIDDVDPVTQSEVAGPLRAGDQVVTVKTQWSNELQRSLPAKTPLTVTFVVDDHDVYGRDETGTEWGPLIPAQVALVSRPNTPAIPVPPRASDPHALHRLMQVRTLGRHSGVPDLFELPLTEAASALTPEEALVTAIAASEGWKAKGLAVMTMERLILATGKSTRSFPLQVVHMVKQESSLRARLEAQGVRFTVNSGRGTDYFITVLRDPAVRLEEARQFQEVLAALPRRPASAPGEEEDQGAALVPVSVSSTPPEPRCAKCGSTNLKRIGNARGIVSLVSPFPGPALRNVLADVRCVVCGHTFRIQS